MKSNIFVDFFNLFYPNTCAACGQRLVTAEKVICTACLSDLPKTGFQNTADNPVSRLFWGRVNIKNATALFRFTKESKFQDLLHLLKYKGRQDVGVELGRQLGHELNKSEFYKNMHIVIPVPLHPKRQQKRGYNQAECIATGIAEAMNIKLENACVIRNIETQTQTKKNRIERWKNVESIFKVTNNKLLENKNILLVDDVITTGATLEACATEIIKTSTCEINVATLAMA